jgi:hypothetical protein
MWFIDLFYLVTGNLYFGFTFLFGLHQSKWGQGIAIILKI